MDSRTQEISAAIEHARPMLMTQRRGPGGKRRRYDDIFGDIGAMGYIVDIVSDGTLFTPPPGTVCTMRTVPTSVRGISDDAV